MDEEDYCSFDKSIQDQIKRRALQTRVVRDKVFTSALLKFIRWYWNKIFGGQTTNEFLSTLNYRSKEIVRRIV